MLRIKCQRIYHMSLILLLHTIRFPVHTYMYFHHVMMPIIKRVIAEHVVFLVWSKSWQIMQNLTWYDISSKPNKPSGINGISE